MLRFKARFSIGSQRNILLSQARRIEQGPDGFEVSAETLHLEDMGALYRTLLAANCEAVELRIGKRESNGQCIVRHRAVELENVGASNVRAMCSTEYSNPFLCR